MTLYVDPDLVPRQKDREKWFSSQLILFALYNDEMSCIQISKNLLPEDDDSFT